MVALARMADVEPQELAPFSAEERRFLTEAVRTLEQASWLERLASMVGKPLEHLAKFVPASVANAGEAALKQGMVWAASSVPAGAGPTKPFAEALSDARAVAGKHRRWLIGSGAAGGLFGWIGTAVELPVSTGLMLRGIASTAAEFGEDPRDPATRLDCLTVFAHGGPHPDESDESAYWTARLGIAQLVGQASRALAGQSAKGVAGMVEHGLTTPLARLLATIAGRFNGALAEKMVAQSIPAIGAVAGGMLNAAFADHFHAVARAHFGVRRLERDHGVEAVRAAYAATQQRLGAGGPSVADALLQLAALNGPKK